MEPISPPGTFKQAPVPFEKIRKAVDDKIDVMVEFHSMWQLLPAMTIARALQPFDTFWHEDPIKMDSLGSLKRYAEASTAPICASETLGGRTAFRDLLETGAAGVIMLDLSGAAGSTPPRDRLNGRGFLLSDCATRLHRSGGPGRFDPPRAQHLRCNTSFNHGLPPLRSFSLVVERFSTLSAVLCGSPTVNRFGGRSGLEFERRAPASGRPRSDRR